MQNKKQDIIMGYSTTTGEPITLREHEAAFATYLKDMDIVAPAYAHLVPEHGHAGAWRKVDQVGYYHALQMDWEAARDDELDPAVVDKPEDLRDYAERIAKHKARGYSYGHCLHEDERATYWQPAHYCGNATHPLDEYCDVHGGRDCDDPLDEQDDIDLAEGNLPSHMI